MLPGVRNKGGGLANISILKGISTEGITIGLFGVRSVLEQKLLVDIACCQVGEGCFSSMGRNKGFESFQSYSFRWKVVN